MEVAKDSLLDKDPKLKMFMENMQDPRVCGRSASDLFQKNLEKNIKLIPKCGNIEEVTFAGHQRAAVFVGASPALKNNIKELVNCDSNFLVIAVNSSLKMLLENNIKPHLVVVADADPIVLERDLTTDIDMSDVMLVASTLTHPSVIKAWKGPVKFVPMGCDDEKGKNKINKRLNKKLCKLMKVPEPFGGAGNALGLAVNIAFGVMGVKTAIFIGMECSFDKEYYCDGKKSADVSQKYPARDIFGNDVETTAPLVMYKTYLEDMASQYCKEGFMFINSTEAGIFGIDPDQGQLPYIHQFKLKTAIELYKKSAKIAEDPTEAEKMKYDLAYKGDNYTSVSHSELHAEEVAKLGKSILDVGCGTGKGVRKLVKLGRDAKGCDISEEVGKYWDGIEHLCEMASAWELPYADNSFDVLMSCDVLEHIPPNLLHETLDEFGRVSDLLYLKISFVLSAEKIENRIEPHLSVYHPDQWRTILEDHGWVVENDGQIFICKKRRN